MKEAIEKIRDEMDKNPKHPYIQVIGQFLLQHIEAHPEAAEKMLAEGKSIKGSLTEMKKEAQKNQVDGCGVLTDEQGFAIVLGYYGVGDKPVKAKITVPEAPVMAPATAAASVETPPKPRTKRATQAPTDGRQQGLFDMLSESARR